MNVYLKSAVAVLNAMSRLPNAHAAAAPDPAEDAHQLALDYGKSLYIYHAGQRHTALNYYFIALAAIVTGIVTVFTHDELWKFVVGPLIVTVLASSGFLLAGWFRKLDERNQSLVNEDKKLLLAVESALEAKHHLPFRILQGGDHWAKEHPSKTYNRNFAKTLLTFRLMFGVMTLLAWLYYVDMEIHIHP